MTQMQINTWTVACSIHALVHAHPEVTMTIDSMRMHAMLLLDSHHRITPLLQLMLTLMAIHHFKTTRASLGSDPQRSLMASGSFIYIYGHACSRESPKRHYVVRNHFRGKGIRSEADNRLDLQAAYAHRMRHKKDTRVLAIEPMPKRRGYLLNPTVRHRFCDQNEGLIFRPF